MNNFKHIKKLFVLQSPLILSPLNAVISQLIPLLILLQIPNGKTVTVRTGKHASPPRKVYLSNKFLGMMEGWKEGEKKMVRTLRVK